VLHAVTLNIRLYALRLYDTLSYNWESNYVQIRPFCHCGAGEKLFLVAARTFVAHLFLHGCACVGVIHKRISTVLIQAATRCYTLLHAVTVTGCCRLPQGATGCS